MTDEIISAIVGTGIFDVVGIYDQNYNRLFLSAHSMKASVNPNAKLMSHPVETGATASDFRILEPVSLELSLLVPANLFDNTYEEVAQAYKAGTILIVQTNASVYTNLMIEGIPHDEDPEMLGLLKLGFKVKEVQFFTTITESIKPQNKKSSNTVDRGEQQPKAPPPSKSGGAELGDKVIGFFK